MLSTIIYRSHITEHVPLEILNGLALKANKINKSSSITGILLFNGTHFFQLLEGPEAAVNAVYSRICQDPRHHNLVELLRDYAPARRLATSVWSCSICDYMIKRRYWRRCWQSAPQSIR